MATSSGRRASLRDVSAVVGWRAGDDDGFRHGRARLAKYVRLQLVAVSVAVVAGRAMGFVHRARAPAACFNGWAIDYLPGGGVDAK